MKKKNLRKRCIILAWIAVWSIGAKALDNNILLAGPGEVAGELFTMLGEAGFYKTLVWSLLRIGGGFFTGFAAAVLLAFLSSRFELLEEALSPVMTLLKTVPVASFVVLLLIWWGSSFLAVAVCFVVVLPNIYINTLEGLKNADKQILQMAQVFRISKKNKFFYIYRSALAPFLYGSMKVSLGMCWKSGVAAELIGTPDYSIGERLYLSKVCLDTAGVFAWTAVIILLSIFFEKCILYLVNCFFRWQPPCSRQGTYGRRRPMTHKRGKAEILNDGGCVTEVSGKPTVYGMRSEEEPSPAVLVVSHVYKAFGGQQVLRDFHEIYEAGKTYILNSPSGSGKTTLLHIMAGLLKPDSGQIVSTGRYSMVFQEDRLCMDYSAVKNVEMVIGDPKRAQRALENLLEAEALHKPCRELSGGMKRRVALVRAMEAESDYVLLDEPFTGLDADTKASVEEYIRKKQNGRTIIIVTHI